ncbi:MAG TPA: DUF4443 domain-containing protein [Nitrososphaera sp.]
MHMYIRALEKVASRYAPSRALSFDVVHVFMAMQFMQKHGRASRESMRAFLMLGEGTIKTLVKHMRMHGLIETSNGGTRLTAKGRGVCAEILSSMPAEMSLPECSIALGKFNYAIILKELGYAIRSGIEQRDAAIAQGATGATTIVFKDSKFLMPATNHDSLKRDRHIRDLLMEGMKPEEGDVIIVGSADNEKTAELAAKNAALLTIISHEKH